MKFPWKFGYLMTFGDSQEDFWLGMWIVALGIGWCCFWDITLDI